MKKCLVLFLFAILAISMQENLGRSENFQMRRVYYSEEDNVCNAPYETPLGDSIEVRFRFDDSEPVSKTVSGDAYCTKKSARAADVIVVLKIFGVFFPSKDKESRTVYFNQTRIDIKEMGFIKGIVANATIHNPVIIEEREYSCVVLGDGQVQRYGDYDNHNATIDVDCSRTRGLENILLE